VNQPASLFILEKVATLLVLQERIGSATVAVQPSRQAWAGLLNPAALLSRFVSQAAAPVCAGGGWGCKMARRCPAGPFPASTLQAAEPPRPEW